MRIIVYSKMNRIVDELSFDQVEKYNTKSQFIYFLMILSL